MSKTYRDRIDRDRAESRLDRRARAALRCLECGARTHPRYPCTLED